MMNAPTDAYDNGTVTSDDDMMMNIPVESPDMGASLPTTEEMRSTVSPYRSGKQGRYIKLIVAAVVLLAVVISIAVGVSGGGTDSSSVSGGGNDSSNGSSASNVAPAPRQANVEDIIAYLADRGVSDLTALSTAETPQRRAAFWLAETDGANLAVPTAAVTTAEGYKYMTRYILAVLYYSTGGELWTSQVGFMTNEDICNWYGLFRSGSSSFRKGVVCDSGLLTGLGISK
jgi:hypothetical protein